MKKGFTLVELLVVIGVLAIVGTLILSTFTQALKGNNKSQIIGVIKQNGQAILELMDKTVRDADNVACPAITAPATSASSSNMVVVSRGVYTRYRFIAPSPSPNPTANGKFEKDNPTKQNVAGSNPLREETDSEFINRVCSASDQPLADQVTILTDTKVQTGTSVDCSGNPSNCLTNPIFTRDRPAGSRDQVTIKFDLKPGLSAPPSLRGQIDPITFQTTIQLR